LEEFISSDSTSNMDTVEDTASEEDYLSQKSEENEEDSDQEDVVSDSIYNKFALLAYEDSD